jgi:hypothetical protein
MAAALHARRPRTQAKTKFFFTKILPGAFYESEIPARKSRKHKYVVG